MRPQPWSGGMGPMDDRVVIEGQEYVGSAQRGMATPYYYGGGMVNGRQVGAGWYSSPWWKTALVAGAAGIGGALLTDTLLEGFGHHHHMGMGGGPGMGGPGFGGDFGGGPGF